jgi:hypothetical protein
MMMRIDDRLLLLFCKLRIVGLAAMTKIARQPIKELISPPAIPPTKRPLCSAAPRRKRPRLSLRSFIIVALWLWNASLLTTAADQNLVPLSPAERPGIAVACLGKGGSFQSGTTSSNPPSSSGESSANLTSSIMCHGSRDEATATAALSFSA